VLREWVEQDEIMTQKRTKLAVCATTQQSLHRYLHHRQRISPSVTPRAAIQCNTAVHKKQELTTSLIVLYGLRFPHVFVLYSYTLVADQLSPSHLPCFRELSR
jgi:hypothetical protein